MLFCIQTVFTLTICSFLQQISLPFHPLDQEHAKTNILLFHTHTKS